MTTISSSLSRRSLTIHDRSSLRFLVLAEPKCTSAVTGPLLRRRCVVTRQTAEQYRAGLPLGCWSSIWVHPCRAQIFGVSTAANNNCSRACTSMPAGSGQPISCSAAFSRYLVTVVLDIPVSRLITLALLPCALRRSTSSIFLIGILLLGMWHLWVVGFESPHKDATASLHPLFLSPSRTL